MALCKEIELEKGIKTNYHRISNLIIAVNKEIQIIVASYVSKEKREEEQLPAEEGQEPAFNIVSSDVVIVPYEEEFSVKTAYEYLKTTEKYKDAEDC